jgi:hypothetical protein
MYRPGPEELGPELRVSGKMRRNERRVPIAGSGSKEGRADVRRWESSRSVHDGQVYICR